MSLLSRLIDFAGRCFAEEYGAVTQQAPSHRLPLLGSDDAEAARGLGGQSRDDPFSHGPYGDWPFVPADLKISLFHARSNATGGQRKNVS